MSLSCSRPRNLPSRWVALTRDTFSAYLRDDVPRLGAALAFYTAVAIVPLLMLAVALGSVILGNDAARRNVLLEIEELAGVDPGKALSAIEPIRHPPSTMAWFSLVIFLIGGFGVFSNLRGSLNTIWKAPVRREAHWLVRLRHQLFSVGAVMGTGFLVLVSLTLSAVLTWILAHASRWGRWPELATESANFLFSFAVVGLLIAVVFKLLPNASLHWKQIWLGAAFTSILFNFGKTVLALYFGRVQLNSLYGSASTVIALLLWCYYAAQIVFLGAEFTRVHALTRGGRVPLAVAAPAAGAGTGTGDFTGRNSGAIPNGTRRPLEVK